MHGPRFAPVYPGLPTIPLDANMAQSRPFTERQGGFIRLVNRWAVVRNEKVSMFTINQERPKAVKEGPMTRKRDSRAKAGPWMRKTIRGTVTKNKKTTFRGKRGATNRLTKADVERFRRMLVDKRSGLVSDMLEMEAEALRGNHQGRNGRPSSGLTQHADQDDSNYERDLTLGLLANEQGLLWEIDEALQLIEAGKYGRCQATGKPISKARLTARPWTKYCIEYARIREKRSDGLGKRDEA